MSHWVLTLVYLLHCIGPVKPKRLIRFEAEEVEGEDEKDTRVKYKPAVSPLQVMMLKMAGQVIPMIPIDVSMEDSFVLL